MSAIETHVCLGIFFFKKKLFSCSVAESPLSLVSGEMRCWVLTFQCGHILQINCVYATAKTVIGINTKIIRTDLECPLTFTIAERAANVQEL